jgi:hypothetical protein
MTVHTSPPSQPRPTRNRGITLDRIARLADSVPLAAGYRFELVRPHEVGHLVADMADWFPDISVGSASRYLREEFYLGQALFHDAIPRDHIVLLLKTCDTIAGMFACEFDDTTQSVYAALGVAAPEHRGSKLAQAGIGFTEDLGRAAGMGFAFGFATLKSPFAQLAFERAGWQLVGIAPGYDREMVEPGIVKRVYEAMYAKVLVPHAGLLHPLRHNMTPRTLAFFDRVFGRGHDTSGPSRINEDTQPMSSPYSAT